MAKRRLLTNKKQDWAKNRDVDLKGKALRVSISNEARYLKQMKRMINAMEDAALRELSKIFASEKPGRGFDSSISNKARLALNRIERQFLKLFRSKARAYSKNMVIRAEKDSKRSLHSSLEKLSGGLSLKTGIVTPETSGIVKSIIDENASLIKSIPSEFMTKIRHEIFYSITNKESSGLAGLEESIYEIIKNRSENARKRAQFIATDQTRKAYNEINRSKLTSLGITHFEWVHSGGGKKPRLYHKNVLNGQVFSFDDLPVIDENTGERGIPGQLPRCRCTMTPAIRFGDKVDG